MPVIVYTNNSLDREGSCPVGEHLPGIYKTQKEMAEISKLPEASLSIVRPGARMTGSSTEHLLRLAFQGSQ